jgi:hypothetical protein
MQAAASHVPEYDPFDPAAAAAMSAPALGSSVQKAIAAMAAKGSMGGKSKIPEHALAALAAGAPACMLCGTTRTPLWREGPYGPKTLCNACGLKRVRAIKAQQQDKNPSQVANPAGASDKKKSSAAARTVSKQFTLRD